MKKVIILCATCLFLLGCKAKKAIVSSGEIDTSLKNKEIVELHKRSFPEFKTISGSVLASYDDGKNSQSISLNFRMEKDKAIWFSAPLGIAKAYITPEKASYYNRLDNTYFDGDFSYISKLLGYEVTFENIQNLLLGQSVYTLNKNAERLQSDTQHYVLEMKEKSNIEVVYGINPSNYRIGFFDIFDTQSGVRGRGEFSYQKVENLLFPGFITIKTQTGNQSTNIELDFRGLKINENLSFPFKIPSGAKKISEF